MTWEYRVLHEVHEVPGTGTEEAYRIIEAYYAKPGKTEVRPTAAPWPPPLWKASCSLCGPVTSGVTYNTAWDRADRHRCPEVVESWSQPFDTRPHGETVEELVSDLVLMLRACWKPVLERKDLPGG
jgi:hypothetical protein